MDVDVVGLENFEEEEQLLLCDRLYDVLSVLCEVFEFVELRRGTDQLCQASQPAHNQISDDVLRADGLQVIVLVDPEKHPDLLKDLIGVVRERVDLFVVEVFCTLLYEVVGGLTLEVHIRRNKPLRVFVVLHQLELKHVLDGSSDPDHQVEHQIPVLVPEVNGDVGFVFLLLLVNVIDQRFTLAVNSVGLLVL